MKTKFLFSLILAVATFSTVGYFDYCFAQDAPKLPSLPSVPKDKPVTTGVPAKTLTACSLELESARKQIAFLNNMLASAQIQISDLKIQNAQPEITKRRQAIQMLLKLNPGMVWDEDSEMLLTPQQAVEKNKAQSNPPTDEKVVPKIATDKK